MTRKDLTELVEEEIKSLCRKIEKAIIKSLKSGRSRSAGSVYEKVRCKLKLPDTALIRAVGFKMIGSYKVRVVSDWKLKLPKRQVI